MTSIHNLPAELLATIFSHLSHPSKVNAACVCSHWSEIIDTPSVWKDFCPVLNVDKLEPQHIEWMNSRMISKMKVVACLSMEKMSELIQALPCLTNVSLHLPDILDTLYPGGNELDGIEDFTIETSDITTAALQSFLQHMVNLNHLTLVCRPKQDIFCALNDSMCLVSLQIKSPMMEVTIAENSESDLTHIASLEYLTLENVTLGDSGLEFISRAFPQLQTLQLKLSADVTSDGLEKLARLKELRYLEVKSAHFEHDWMEHLQTNLSKLEEFRLWNCKSISKECLQSISKMTELVCLTVPIQDQEVEGLHVLSQGCPNLRELWLRYGNADINQGLSVVQHMPCLQDLVLLKCSVNDDFWRNNSNSFKKLRALDVVKFLSLSEDCWRSMSQMSNFMNLFLKDCKSTQNKSMMLPEEKTLYKNMIFLTLIGLGINDESLKELCELAPFLITVTIVSCNNVTEKGLVAAVSNLPCLKALLSNISIETKHRLKSIRPCLQLYPA